MKLNDSATIRAKLETWLNRLSEAGYPEFHYLVIQFWTFLGDNPVLDSLCERLQQHPAPAGHMTWDGALTPLFIRNFSAELLYFDTEQDHCAFCYHVVRHCIAETHADHHQDKLQIESEFARRYYANPSLANQSWMYGYFVKNIVRPLIIYLEEALDSNKSVLAILQRYKHKCEWFQRQALHDLWSHADSKGEWVLKLHLYEYLHDNGVQFIIDPYSPLGQADLVSVPDLVSTQEGSERLIADGKLIRPGKG
ncbi:MAG TPA: hypothetical protein VFE62_14565, partial [Gemmataceae bacterium]|nr:hypothetical protein [Gemmataceae bacterium]